MEARDATAKGGIVRQNVSQTRFASRGFLLLTSFFFSFFSPKLLKQGTVTEHGKRVCVALRFSLPILLADAAPIRVV